MNRRSFISAMLRAGTAAAVLPAATTYARIWIPERRIFRANFFGVRAQLDACGNLTRCSVITPTPLDLEKLFADVYAISKTRRHKDMIIHKSDVPYMRRLINGLAR